MDRTLLLLAAFAGFTGVTLGAFGAHGLKGRLSADMLAVFETAVRYHLVHAVALLATAALAGRAPLRSLALVGWFFALGIILFSGSLYVMALTGNTRLGMITPLGGLAFLVGWALLAIAAI
jgi:uncharacterized membrane protein YgdD (TMEM256/DUF423 family)